MIPRPTQLKPRLNETRSSPDISPERSSTRRNPRRRHSLDALGQMEAPFKPMDESPPSVDKIPPSGTPAQDPYYRIWPIYNQAAEEFDSKNRDHYNRGMDILLLFAALFSAIITAFLSNSLNDLKPDYARMLLLFEMARNQPVTSSDPTKFSPSNVAIVVNCLWIGSLACSLGASFGAVLCKELINESNDTAHMVQLQRVCQRHTRFMAFDRWILRLSFMLLPVLHYSVFLFSLGMGLYLWTVSQPVAIFFYVLLIPATITYFFVILLPIFTAAPSRTSTTIIAHYVIYYGLRIVGSWWTFPVSPTIDTSSEMQDRAFLWLMEIPLTSSKAADVAQALEKIRAPRFRTFIQPHVIMFLSASLESCFDDRHLVGGRFSLARDCLLVLSRMKSHLVIEFNADTDDVIGDVTLDGFAAWAVQNLLESEDMNGSTYSRLAAAAAWLSPVHKIDHKHYGRIHEMGQYLPIIKHDIETYTNNYDQHGSGILIETIEAMHAFIPRGMHDQSSTSISFLQLFSENLDAPWFNLESEQETILALTFYALDVVTATLPSSTLQSSRPWARRDKSFDLKDLASLGAKYIRYSRTKVTPMSLEAIGFIFSVIYKFPGILQTDATPYPLNEVVEICDNLKELSNGSFDAESTNFVLQRGTMAYTAMLHDALKAQTQPMFTTRDHYLHSSISSVLSRIRVDNPPAQLYSVYALSMIMKLAHGAELIWQKQLVIDLLLVTPNMEGGNVALQILYLKVHLALILRTTGTHIDSQEPRFREVMQAITHIAVVDHDPRMKWIAIYLAVILGDLTAVKGLDPGAVSLLDHLQTMLKDQRLRVVCDWRNFDLPFRESDKILMEQAPLLNEAAFEWFHDFPLLPI